MSIELDNLLTKNSEIVLLFLPRQVLFSDIDNRGSTENSVMLTAELQNLEEDVESKCDKPHDPQHSHREELNVLYATDDEEESDETKPERSRRPARRE